MNTDNALTNLLVTRECDGDIRSRMGRTQKFLAAEVHSSQEIVQIGCRFYHTVKRLVDRIGMDKEKWSGWPDLNRQPMDISRRASKPRLLQSIALPSCSEYVET